MMPNLIHRQPWPCMQEIWEGKEGTALDVEDIMNGSKLTVCIQEGQPNLLCNF